MTEDAAAVRSLVEDLVDAYSSAQVERAIALFADDAVFVGTGADEIRVGRSEVRTQIERDLGQAAAVKARYDDLEIRASGDAAWLFALVTVEATVGRQSVTMPMRMTATMTPTDGRWQFRQVHFSLPLAEQAEGQSFGPLS